MLRTRRFFLSLFLSFLPVALALCAVPAFAAENNVRASGECGANGNNLTWTLTDNGVLTVSGSGPMKDYDKTEVSFLGKERAPWYEYRSGIGRIVLEEGVTSAGEYAFYVFPNPLTVQLPQSLNLIGEHAFDTDGAVNAVYYMAPIGRFGSINVQSNNERLLSAPRHSHVTGGGTSSTRQENVTQATCTAAGGYDVTERCNYCQLVLGVTHTTLPPLGHLSGSPVTENEVPATAQSTGRYDRVYYCTRCGAELFRNTVTIPATGGSAPAATLIANPFAGLTAFHVDPTGQCDFVLPLPADPFYDNYAAAEAAEHVPNGGVSASYSLNNAVFDQDGNQMAVAQMTLNIFQYHSGCYVEVSQQGNLSVRFGFGNGSNVGGACFNIVQTYGSLTQTTSVRIEQTRKQDYMQFEFRDADGRRFLTYEYGELYIEQNPKVLKASPYGSSWLSLVSPYFTHTVSPNGYDMYTVNQTGILPVYPPKAPDAANHYEFDHWATDALLTGTNQPLDLDTIDSWTYSYRPNYQRAVFYPVYTAVAHSFVGYTDVAPTCGTEGTGHYVCSGCGCEGESYAIPATGHDFDEGTITTPATCTSEGVKTFTCRNDPSHVYTETVPATAHPNAVTVPEAAATATEHGHTEGVWCPDCETWLSGHEVIHNTLGERVYLDEYTEDGEQMVRIKCTVCGGEGLYAMEPIPQSEPETDTPDNGTNSQPTSPISKAIQSIINFFLRLIKWFSNISNAKK